MPRLRWRLTWRRRIVCAAFCLNRRISTGAERKPSTGAHCNWHRTMARPRDRWVRYWRYSDIRTRRSNWFGRSWPAIRCAQAVTTGFPRIYRRWAASTRPSRRSARRSNYNPGHADYYTQLAIVAIQRGDARAALSAAQQEIAAGGWQDIALALAQQISGDPVAADTALKTLVDKQAKGAAYQIAEVYALRNDPDKVFEWLDHAWANRDTGVGQLLYDPFIIRYKHDPRFAASCRKAGLPVPGEPAAAKATPAANPAQTATPTPPSGQVP